MRSDRSYNVWSVRENVSLRKAGTWDVLKNEARVANFRDEGEALGYARRRHEEDPNAL